MCHIVYEFKSVLHFTGGLVLTELGENCKSRGMIPMDSMEDCKAHTRFLQTYFSPYEFKSSMTSSNAPGGCIIWYNTHYRTHFGYFNTNYNGTRNDRYSLCQPGEKLKKKLSIGYSPFNVYFFYQYTT